jgi:hypothetical protein
MFRQFPHVIHRRRNHHLYLLANGTTFPGSALTPPESLSTFQKEKDQGSYAHSA